MKTNIVVSAGARKRILSIFAPASMTRMTAVSVISKAPV